MCGRYFVSVVLNKCKCFHFAVEKRSKTSLLTSNTALKTYRRRGQQRNVGWHTTTTTSERLRFAKLSLKVKTELNLLGCGNRTKSFKVGCVVRSSESVGSRKRKLLPFGRIAPGGRTIEIVVLYL